MSADKVESATQYADTPVGWAERWAVEFNAARKKLEKPFSRSEKCVKRYLDERESGREDGARLNLFWSDVQTREAMTYGKIPSVDVARRFGDSSDDVARVGGEMLERLLNTDIERDSDTFAEACQQALQDRLIAGLGCVRLRYVAEFEPVPEAPAQVDPETGAELAPAVPATERKSREDVESEYVYWRDQLWSPSRTFAKVRWWAFRAEMTREDLKRQFGEKVGSLVPLNVGKRQEGGDAERESPWGRAEVWEIWDKEHRCCWWYVEGYGSVLTPAGVKANENGSLPDPLGLEGFWPFPRPLLANVTTTSYVHKPDYAMAQDLYRAIDELEQRIEELTKAVKVAGVYDKTADGVKRLLSQGGENILIPVENMAALTEKGGLRGVIEWMPLDQVVGALDKLTVKLNEKVAQLYQVTGMSDIMRGQASSSATATEQAAKVRFGSVRTQHFQDEFARFVTDAQQIKGEIISKHFEPQTIIERSNVQFTADAPMAMEGAQFVKDRFNHYRIQVRSESVAQTDFAALQNDRTACVAALGQLWQALMPMVTSQPAVMPFALEVSRWVLAGFKGSSTIEGVFDQAIEAAKKAAMQPKPPPPPDPKLETAKVKGQIDIAKAKLGMQATQMQTQAHVVKAQADIAKTRAQTEAAAMGGHMWGRNAALVEGGGEQ